jgi:molecular chaperone DnaK
MNMKTITNSNELQIGIDLGTTNSVVCITDSTGAVKVLPNTEGDLITPSAISVESKPPVVGKGAKQDRFFSPETYAEQFKRYMVQITDDGSPVALVKSPDGTEFTAITLSAEVLAYLKESAEKIEGRKFKKAVIGVPAYFKQAARQATKNAGIIAGFEEVHIVDEPTAAATYYCLAKGEKTRIAVFDFGGGTFDICILEIEPNGEITLIAVDGDPECGGGNVDEALFQIVRAFLQEKGYELSPEKDLAEWLEVLDKCKEAKEALARKDKTIIPLRIGNERTSMELTYDQLKEYSAPVIEILSKCCQRALEKAKLQPSQIDKVVLVGGSTRLRFVPEIIKDIFDQDPVTDTDVDLTIGKGIAIIAATQYGQANQQIVIEGRKYLAGRIKTQQIAARDLCVAAIIKKDEGDENEYNVPIIPASSKLPYEATEHFAPIEARTNKVSVKIYDGHANELSKNCTPLRETEVQVQPTEESNNKDRIEFKILMDTEGLVHIDVRDKLCNKPVPIKLKFDTGLSDSDVQEERGRFLARHQKSEN